MPRSPSPGLALELAKDINLPGVLVEIAFTSPWRASSRGDLTFNGVPFNAAGFRISGLSSAVDSSSVSGQLEVDDPQRLLTQQVLSEGVSERRIKAWYFYGDPPPSGALDADKAVHKFSGYGDECAIDPNRGVVSIRLVSASGRTTYSPRLRLTKQNGYNWLPARYTVLEFGGERFVLEPE